MAFPVPVPNASSQVPWPAKKELENLEEFIDGPGLEMTYIPSIHIPMTRIKSNDSEAEKRGGAEACDR